MTSRRRHKKVRTSDITEYRTFTDNFILRPIKSFHTDVLSLIKGPRDRNKTYPVLKVEKPTGTRWRLKAIPNLRGIPNGRMQPSSTLVRIPTPDTYDEDFMMPSQVREVLEKEGLEHNVITGVIGHDEEKHKQLLRDMKHGNLGPSKDRVVLPPVITTQKPGVKYDKTRTSSSWLDLARQQPRDQPILDLWENPKGRDGRDGYLSWNYGRDMRQMVEEIQFELDRKKWMAAQHVEQLYVGDNFRAPRVVLVSSRVPKCHLLTQVYNDTVIPILYDYDSCTFTEILDAIAKKLDLFKRNCKAKSIMVLCQGGPGYIYFLKNFAITPQKLHKPSYRCVVGFWRALSGLLSKLNPQEAAIQFYGFKLTDNEQGKQLLPMLQSLMYPNLVRVEVVTDDSETGRNTVAQYFKYNRLQVWKSHQMSSQDDIDFIHKETGPVKRHYILPVLRVAR